MSLLSHLYVSSVEDAVLYDEEPDSAGEHRAEFKGLTYEDFSYLWARLRGEEHTEADSEAFELVLDQEDGERLINKFPEDFVTRLAALDEEGMRSAASMWVEWDEFAADGVEPDDILPVVEGLQKLSVVATSTKKGLFLWMCV
jgi:hypothetical protein